MITIYHGSRPQLPLLACCRHLDIADDIAVDKAWDWRLQPLRLMGVDRHGAAVCCLVHGCYQELYYKALSGIAAVFGLTVNLVDIEYLLCRQASSWLYVYFGIPLARYFSFACRLLARRPVDKIVKTYIMIQQEGRY